jgi:TRAP-type C4-dicarboxylate transport system permease small subunit
MKIIRILTNIFSRIIDLMAIFAGILLIFSMVSISMGVASRYLFDWPMAWVTEITEYILVHITFLVAPWVLKREGHVTMDLVLNRLSPRTQSMFNMITYAMSAIVCFILFGSGVRVTWDLYRTRYFTPTVLELPKFAVIAVIFIGSLFLFLQFLNMAFKYLSAWRASDGQRKGLEEIKNLN